MSEEEKEEWIRKPALMVLIYEGVVAEVGGGVLHSWGHL